MSSFWLMPAKLAAAPAARMARSADGAAAGGSAVVLLDLRGEVEEVAAALERLADLLDRDVRRRRADEHLAPRARAVLRLGLGRPQRVLRAVVERPREADAPELRGLHGREHMRPRPRGGTSAVVLTQTRPVRCGWSRSRARSTDRLSARRPHWRIMDPGSTGRTRPGGSGHVGRRSSVGAGGPGIERAC